MKEIKYLLCIFILVCGVSQSFAQDNSVAVSGHLNIATSFNYDTGYGITGQWFLNVPQDLLNSIKIKKNIVYLGEAELFIQKKKYVDSGKGVYLGNKARIFLTKNIFAEGGVRNGWFYTTAYNKRATYVLGGGGVKLKKHYIYYTLAKNIHKYTDDGVNYINNKEVYNGIAYDAFLPFNEKIYGLFRMRATRLCGEQPEGRVGHDAGRQCGNFYYFSYGIGIK